MAPADAGQLPTWRPPNREIGFVILLPGGISVDTYDSQLDLASMPALTPRKATPIRPPRRFVGIQFSCCGFYSRVYISRDLSAYVGHCPGCARQVRLEIAPEGTQRRFFTAS